MKIGYSKIFYRFTHILVYIFMHIIYRIDVEGLENIPKDSNYILAGNHLHILDGGLLLACNKADIRFVVDVKLYRTKPGKLLFTTIGTVPTTPDSPDVNALKIMYKLLTKGEVLAIFPEGHTHSRDKDLDYKSGVAKLSRLADVPVLPFWIDGTYMPFSKLILIFGEAIDYKEIPLPNKEIDSHLENSIKSLRLK